MAPDFPRNQPEDTRHAALPLSPLQIVQCLNSAALSGAAQHRKEQLPPHAGTIDAIGAHDTS